MGLRKKLKHISEFQVGNKPTSQLQSRDAETLSNKNFGELNGLFRSFCKVSYIWHGLDNKNIHSMLHLCESDGKGMFKHL